MTFPQSFGLALFVLALVVAVVVALVDAGLWVFGKKTISERIWTALALWRKDPEVNPFPWWAIVLVAWLCLIPLGLAMHFFL
jgi:hypothetical protein